MNFFVVGLPRSRTAWLANFLTFDHRFCFHEGLNGCESLDQYRQKLGADKGDSSTGLMLINLNKLYPDAPVVIVENDPAEAIRYGRQTFGYDISAYIYGLQKKLEKLEGLRVQKDEINENLPLIWNHLIGTAFNHQRAELLIKLNIQINEPYQLDEKAAVKLWNTLN